MKVMCAEGDLPSLREAFELCRKAGLSVTGLILTSADPTNKGGVIAVPKPIAGITQDISSVSIDPVGLGLEQLLEAGLVPFLRSPQQRRLTVVILGLDVSLGLGQLLDGGVMSSLGGSAQRRLPVAILGLDVSLGLGQLLDGRVVPSCSSFDPTSALASGSCLTAASCPPSAVYDSGVRQRRLTVHVL
jgi:hypothetical protein